MTIGKYDTRILTACLSLLILGWSASAHAQSSIAHEVIEPRLNLSQVMDKLVEKNAERMDALQKYQNRRFYSLDYTGFPTSFHAEMVVDMIYDAPGTKQFKIISQSGATWIIDRILKRLLDAEQEAQSEANRQRVALDPSNYNFSGFEHLDAPDNCSYVMTVEPKIPSKLLFRGRIWVDSSNYNFSGFEHLDAPDNCSYVMTVEPKIPSKLLFRGRIWVDSRDFAVCRIEAEPSKNPSFWIKKTDIHHSYLKVGDFWLPAENKSVSAIRGGGRAVLTIMYQNYEILAARSLKGNDPSSSSSFLALPDPAN
jgi:hypothetical protein